MPLTVGADAYADAGEDGTIRMPLVTLDPIAAGSYTVWITAGSAPFGYSIQLPLMVTAESSAAPSADIAPSSGASSSAVAPAPSSPLVAITPSTTTPRVDRPAPPAPSAAPSPSPSPDVDPLEGDIAPPALPVPTSPAR